MPLYDYKCRVCNHAAEEFFKITTRSEPLACPKCCVADGYERQVSLPHTDLKEFHTPIEMYSVALDNDEEIKAFKTRCPDVDVSTDEADPMYGIPVARNRKQKLAALAAAGFQETNSERVR